MSFSFLKEESPDPPMHAKKKKIQQFMVLFILRQGGDGLFQKCPTVRSSQPDICGSAGLGCLV